MSERGRAFGGTPVTHFGYNVPDIAAAVDHWVETTGAGPFVRIGDGPIPLEEAEHRGEPAEWSHSTATGQWGGVTIEISEGHSASPASLAEEMGVGVFGLHHVGWFAADLEAESKRLEALGAPLILAASRGEQRIRFHDARVMLGARIELYEPQQAVLDHFALLREAAAAWDGRGPRLLPIGEFVDRYAV
jgi:Glyoxalase/Bleomycin resistance protein/Dioxygenase superfamily